MLIKVMRTQISAYMLDVSLVLASESSYDLCLYYE
jgi:hypothetical protein